MSDQTAIEWTDATWNPVTGCSKVSPGCAHCYAEAVSLRFGRSVGPWTPANAAENVVLHPDRLDQPLRWRRPRMVFVNSMSDLFHEQIPDDYIARVFGAMAAAPQHTFQVLTKRPERMRSLVSSFEFGFEVHRRADALEGRTISFGGPWPLPNVWLGVSIENRRFVHRADLLRETPAAVRFISAEPLLGPLIQRVTHGRHCLCSACAQQDWADPRLAPCGMHGPSCSPRYAPIRSLDLHGIDWLIVGGESGGKHRPMRVEWVRDLRGAAQDAGTAFFFKQWGGRTPKAGGRELDGRTWDEMPQREAVAA